MIEYRISNEVPVFSGQVVAMFYTTEKGALMERLQTAKIIAGEGISGDRYQMREGYFSGSANIVDEERQLTLMALNGFVEGNKILIAQGLMPMEMSETRRNIFVNVDYEFLNSLIGKRFKLGNLLLEGVKHCRPCNRPSELVGKIGFETAFKDKGGIRVRVIEGGYLYENDLLNASKVFLTSV